MILVGDVRDKITIIIDDMADTCETLRSAADTLQKANCKKVRHNIFSFQTRFDYHKIPFFI